MKNIGDLASQEEHWEYYLGDHRAQRQAVTFHSMKGSVYFIAEDKIKIVIPQRTWKKTGDFQDFWDFTIIQTNNETSVPGPIYTP